MSGVYEQLAKRWLVVFRPDRPNGTYLHRGRFIQLLTYVGGGVNGYGMSIKYTIVLKEKQGWCAACGRKLNPSNRGCHVHADNESATSVCITESHETMDDACREALQWIEENSMQQPSEHTLCK